MVLAAATMRIPAALVRGGRAPRAREPARAAVRAGASSSPIRSTGATGRSFRVVGRPIPARARADPAGRGARDLRAAARRARAARRRVRSPARARSTSSSIEAFGEVGPGDPAHLRRARLPARCSGAVKRPDYRADPDDRPDRRRVLGRRPRARARRQLRLGARGRRASRRSSSRIRSRPPTTRRRTPSYFVRAGGAIMVRDLDLEDVPDRVRSLLDDPTRLARDGRGDAARRAAGRRRGDRRGADRACRPLDGPAALVRRHRRRRALRLRAARARMGRRGRRLGPRRDAATSTRSATCRSRSRPSRSCPTAGRRSSRRAYPGVAGTVAGGVPRRARRRCGARSSSRARTARGRRRR